MTIEVKKYDQNGNELAIRFGLGGIKAVGVNMIEEMVRNRNSNNKGSSDGFNFKDIYHFASEAGTKVINKKSIEALAKSGAFDSICSNRHQIVESVEIICKYSAAKEEEKNSNQMSLFSSAQIIEDKPALKNCQDWNQAEKLQEEFKAFGFFLNEHPIDNFLDQLRKRGVILSEDLENLDDNNIVKLAGVVAYSKHKSGPKGRYAYLTLSDPFGIYETSIFDEALITNDRDKMSDGKSLVIECLIKKDQGGLRLLVKSIEKLEDFIQFTPAKKEAYQDIKKQGKRTEFDWKKKNKENKTDIRGDVLVLETEHKRRMEELKNKKIVDQVVIEIDNRQSILKLKSFLSQRLAPQEFDKYTSVYLSIIIGANNQRSQVKLEEKYLLNEQDILKIESIKNQDFNQS